MIRTMTSIDKEQPSEVPPLATSTNYLQDVDGAGYVPYLTDGETESRGLAGVLQVGLEATVQSWPGGLSHEAGWEGVLAHSGCQAGELACDSCCGDTM